MDESFKDFEEAEEAGDLVQDVYTYLNLFPKRTMLRVT